MSSRTATLFVSLLVLATGLVSAQPGRAATVTVVAFTTAAPFTATVSPADAATLVPGMVLQNPFAGTPSILAINTATGVITLTSEILSPVTPLPAVVVFATPHPGTAASVTVVAFTTAAPFTATVSPAADAAKLVLGMFVLNPFAGTPSIIGIDPATGVITLTSEILSPVTPLPAAVVFAIPNPGTAASVTVVAFTTAAPFTATVSPAADAAKLAIGMVLQNPFAGTPTITAIDPATGVITLTSEILSPVTPLPAVVVFAIPGTLPSSVPVLSMPTLAVLALLLAGLGWIFSRKAQAV
jgi:hypothetical protein